MQFLLKATTSRRRFLARSLAASGPAAVTLPGASSAVETNPKSGALNVKDFGAIGDGITLDTVALQKAIDACADNGGGTVWFPPGRYLSGTISRDMCHPVNRPRGPSRLR
jgi:hypothetical protein